MDYSEDIVCRMLLQRCALPSRKIRALRRDTGRVGNCAVNGETAQGR